mmetsp:Transcript_12494/g.52564  ORF Transcript_12494/g.52564 Transcript_12494/m.52564 type:complete len:258 (+) Transcript_12494:493-1266(+)
MKTPAENRQDLGHTVRPSAAASAAALPPLLQRPPPPPLAPAPGSDCRVTFLPSAAGPASPAPAPAPARGPPATVIASAAERLPARAESLASASPAAPRSSALTQRRRFPRRIQPARTTCGTPTPLSRDPWIRTHSCAGEWPWPRAPTTGPQSDPAWHTPTLGWQGAEGLVSTAMTPAQRPSGQASALGGGPAQPAPTRDLPCPAMRARPPSTPSRPPPSKSSGWGLADARASRMPKARIPPTMARACRHRFRLSPSP